MYFIVLIVCLQGEPQCIPLVQDPPGYYETIESCREALMKDAEELKQALIAEKHSGTISGQCVKEKDVSPT